MSNERCEPALDFSTTSFDELMRILNHYSRWDNDTQTQIFGGVVNRLTDLGWTEESGMTMGEALRDLWPE